MPPTEFLDVLNADNLITCCFFNFLNDKDVCPVIPFMNLLVQYSTKNWNKLKWQILKLSSHCNIRMFGIFTRKWRLCNFQKPCDVQGFVKPSVVVCTLNFTDNYPRSFPLYQKMLCFHGKKWNDEKIPDKPSPLGLCFMKNAYISYINMCVCETIIVQTTSFQNSSSQSHQIMLMSLCLTTFYLNNFYRHSKDCTAVVCLC